MVFTQNNFTDPQLPGGGETLGESHIILTSKDFEDGLQVGRFAQYVSGGSPTLQNMDGSASPVIAGVVKRYLGREVEEGETINTDLHTHMQYVRWGLCTVDVRDGESPERFGRVYVSNKGDADDGLATADSADLEVNATFVHEVTAGTWVVFLAEPLGNFEPVTTGIYVPETITDPGDTGTLEANQTGSIPITVDSGNETRTLPDPESIGHVLSITLDVNNGTDVTITADTAINQTGNNTITLANAGEFIALTSVQVGGSLVWRVIGNDDAALSTV